MVRYSIQVALLLLVAIYAWRKGGEPEKHVASILVGMHAVSFAYAMLAGQWTNYAEFPAFRIALDLAGLALLTFVALRADRWWPLWIASLQLVTVFAHTMRVIDAQLPPLVYVVMERWPFWIMILVTGVGTLLHSGRQSKKAARIT